jgi:hypothetical protein
MRKKLYIKTPIIFAKVSIFLQNASIIGMQRKKIRFAQKPETEMTNS